MNYRHVYHAGSFVDVFKHVCLIGLLKSLARKETPYCYIDTHAGIGHYDLLSENANKTKEYVNGIERVIAAANPPELVKAYLHCVHTINNELTASNYASLRYYPGSPQIARFFARPHDRVIACELHPEDYQLLRSSFNGDKQVSLHHMDGFLGLKSFLPPKERRGVVLIDPPYEHPDEFLHLAKSLPTALKRWETGVYAIWYPIKEKKSVEKLYTTLLNNIDRPILSVELTTYPDIPNHLNGSGMIIINPPWQFDTLMEQTLPWLWKALTINNQGEYRTKILKSQ